MTERVYGCHNRKPLRETAWVQDGWQPVNWHNTHARVVKSIPAPMSKDCKYTHTDLGQKDARCAGCCWRHEGTPS